MNIQPPMLGSGFMKPKPGPVAPSRLPDIVNDDISITMKIQGEEWDVLDGIVELSTNNTPDFADLEIYPPEGMKPSSKISKTIDNGGLVGAEFTLDIDNSFRTDDENMQYIQGEVSPGGSSGATSQKGFGEITRVFTGKVANISPYGSMSYELIAYDPSQNPFEEGSGFMSDKVTIGFPNSQFAQQELPDWTDRRIKASALVQTIAEKSGIPSGKVNIRLHPNGFIDDRGQDIELSFSDYEVEVGEALSDAATSTNSEWWFGRYGFFNFGAPAPQKFALRYIIDTSAGIRSPNWNSVKVVGDGVVSKDGWAKSALINEEFYTTGMQISDTPGRPKSGLKKPTFVYRNLEINTQQEADNAAKQIVNKLEKQAASGTITIVGMPEIRPYDAVVMPNTQQQPLGGETYGITKVEHRLSGSNGFVTKLTVEGISGIHNSVTISNEVTEGEKIFDPRFYGYDSELYRAAARMGNQ